MIINFLDFFVNLFLSIIGNINIPALPSNISSVLTDIEGYFSQGVNFLAYFVNWDVVIWGVGLVLLLEVGKKIIWLYGIIYDAVKNLL